MVLKSSFELKIQWRLPEGDVPFKKNDELYDHYRTYKIRTRSPEHYFIT